MDIIIITKTKETRKNEGLRQNNLCITSRISSYCEVNQKCGSAGKFTVLEHVNGKQVNDLGGIMRWMQKRENDMKRYRKKL